MEHDREALRKRLRDKIRSKRGADTGPQLAQRLKDDPTTTMLQMGLDDPALLTKARTIANNPHQFMKSVGVDVAKTKPQKTRPAVQPSVYDDDEEAPPPQT